MDATHVHIGGFYVCKGLHGGLPAAVKRLKARGVKVSMVGAVPGVRAHWKMTRIV